ncbi:MAG: hypothetical protein PHR16_16560 [Methylovulum sp.]|nr:hypothetical protein [Methylovulum sp.]
MSTAFDYTEAQIRNALIKTSPVGWAGGFAHRLHYGFVSRGHEQHVPTLPGYVAAYQYSLEILKWVFWLLLLGLCATQTIFAEPEPHKTPVPPKLRILVDRDPCEYPKLRYCTELTNVQIGRYAFKVPYNLIKAFPSDNAFMELMPEWPTMEGLVKNDKGDTFDIIRIMINTLRPAKPTEEGIRYYIQRDRLFSVPLPELGLLEYRRPEFNKVAFAYVPTDQANLLPNNQPLFILRAFRPDGEFSHAKPDPAKGGIEGTYTCSYGYTLREGLYVSVEFYNRHIKDWKAITIAVRNLVESFIQE